MAYKSLVLDSSAFVAMIRGEDKTLEIQALLMKADTVLLSSATRLEICMVLSSRSAFREENMVRAQRDFGITTVPFSEEHAICAFDAFLKFGKGNHRAALNFGDCQAYATAKLAGLPILCIGNDFGFTDLEVIQF